MMLREEIAADLRNIDVALGRLKGQRDIYTGQLVVLDAEASVIVEQIAILDRVRIFLQKLGEVAREEAKTRIEGVVTVALQYVFGTHFSFRINLRGTISRPEADFIVVSRYGEREIANSPESSRGGGIVDIVSTALRFALIELERPEVEGPLFLDEPFKHVSEEYRDNAINLLMYMVNSSGRQVIIITHDPRLASAASNSVRVRIGSNGVSEIF